MDWRAMGYKYDIILYWSEEDEAFIAEVPDLPGCNAHGPTYEDAIREAQVAMDLWVETQKELGHLIPGRISSTGSSQKTAGIVIPEDAKDAALVKKTVTVEMGKRSGQPCIRGMRLTVDDVLGYLAGGMTEKEVLHDFPELTTEDIRACHAFDEIRKTRGVRYRW